VDDELHQTASHLLGGDSASAKLEAAIVKANAVAGSQPQLLIPVGGQKAVSKKPTMINLDFGNEG